MAQAQTVGSYLYSPRIPQSKLENRGWTPIITDENMRTVGWTFFPHHETGGPTRNRAVPQSSVFIRVHPWLNYHVRSQQQQPALHEQCRHAVEKQSEKSP